jgi:hypothetical protein
MMMTNQEEIKAELFNREGFRNVFSHSESGSGVLTWILNECGYFATDPDNINPVMIALCNRILNKCGVIHPANLFEDTVARLNNANDDDLHELEKQIGGES